MALPESLDRATVLDLSDGTVLASLPHPAGPGPAQDWHSLKVVLAPDGREAVTFNQNSPTPLLLHRLGRGSEAPVRLDAPDFPLLHLSFTDRHELVAQGRKLAQDPMSQRVWSLPSGRVVSTSTEGRGPANRGSGRPGAAAIDGALQQMLFADTPNRAFARSADAHLLAAVFEDDIRIYSTDTEELVQMACERSLRGLSADEWRRYIGIAPAHPACGPAN